MKKMDSRYVGNYPILETIIEKIEVQENHDALFWLIDGGRLRGILVGWVRRGMRKNVRRTDKVISRLCFIVFDSILEGLCLIL